MKKANEKYLNTRDDDSRKNYADNFVRIFGGESLEMEVQHEATKRTCRCGACQQASKR